MNIELPLNEFKIKYIANKVENGVSLIGSPQSLIKMCNQVIAQAQKVVNSANGKVIDSVQKGKGYNYLMVNDQGVYNSKKKKLPKGARYKKVEIRDIKEVPDSFKKNSDIAIAFITNRTNLCKGREIMREQGYELPVGAIIELPHIRLLTASNNDQEGAKPDQKDIDSRQTNKQAVDKFNWVELNFVIEGIKVKLPWSVWLYSGTAESAASDCTKDTVYQLIHGEFIAKNLGAFLNKNKKLADRIQKAYNKRIHA